MEAITEFKSLGYTRANKRWLYVPLLGSGVVMLLPLYWTNREMQISLGEGVSQAILTYQFVLLFFLITIGFIVAVAIDLMIKCRLLIFSPARPGKWAERIGRLWGYGIAHNEEMHDVPVPMEDQVEEFKPTRAKRRGRKPSFPLERWIPIAEKWENRDSIRDAFTLEELIEEHLGTNPDGSPIVSKQAYYYTWRDRALAEIAKRNKRGRKPK